MADPFFDTNILVDWLQDCPQAATELLSGEPPETRPRVQQLISYFEVVEIEARAATAAADIRNRTKIKLLDALVLATAQVHGAILVTRNTKDFPASMPGVRIPYTL